MSIKKWDYSMAATMKKTECLAYSSKRKSGKVCMKEYWNPKPGESYGVNASASLRTIIFSVI